MPEATTTSTIAVTIDGIQVEVRPSGEIGGNRSDSGNQRGPGGDPDLHHGRAGLSYRHGRKSCSHGAPNANRGHPTRCVSVAYGALRCE